MLIKGLQHFNAIGKYRYPQIHTYQYQPSGLPAANSEQTTANESSIGKAQASGARFWGKFTKQG